MTIDGVRLELHHFAPAHTSDDLIVHRPAQKIVSTGDIVVTNRADDNPNTISKRMVRRQGGSRA